ncbi:MAG: hypothetical protein MI921_04770 [Cytophagales bacterium]|nr:hypothetical protein [Cytophagales bacterium]
MKKYLSIMLFSVPVLSFIACELTTLEESGTEDDDMIIQVFEPETIPSSITEFETMFHGDTQITWSAISFTLAGFEGLQNCRLDDTIIVMADGTYQYDGGEVLCGAEDSQRFRSGTWQIINNGNNILFDEGTSRQYTARVNGLEDRTISLSGEYLGLEIRGIYTSN